MICIYEINSINKPKEYIRLNKTKVGISFKNKILIFIYISLLLIIIYLFAKTKILMHYVKRLSNLVIALKKNITKSASKKKRIATIIH